MASDNKPALKRRNDSEDAPNKKVRFNNETVVKHFTNEDNDNKNLKEKEYYNNTIEDDDDEEEEIEDFEKCTIEFLITIMLYILILEI